MFSNFRFSARVLPFLVACICCAAGADAQTFNYITSLTDVGNPTGVALDVIGGVTYLYVSDHNGGRVFKYNLSNGTRTQIGFPGRGTGQFVWPDAIAIEPVTHDVYIPDRQLHRVVRLKNTGEFVMQWGGDGPETNRFGFPGAGTAPGQFNEPVGAIIDAAGNLYISEHENHRVQKFRVTQTNGVWNVEVLKIWGSGGGSPGQFNTPYCVTLDGSGNVWVADGYNSRVQKFSPNGDLLGEIGIRGASEPHLVCTWVTFDPAGDLYVSVTSDPNTGGVLQNQHVQKINPAGISLGKWGVYGSEPGNFKLPFGIAIDRATNRAYVADWDNGRVQVFQVGPSTTPVGRPTITTQPSSRAVNVGASTSFTVATSSTNPTFQWQLNGRDIPGATSATYTVSSVQPVSAGVYTAVVTDAGGATTSSPAVLAVSSSVKIAGAAAEVGSNIKHPNGNTYDQILLQGPAATVTADPDQVVRISYEDLNHDIVQVEFSGAGALTLTLDAATGPAAPQNYSQPGISYMRGHGSIVVAGANETTNLAVFSVGRANAVDQSIFKDVTYDGWADLAGVSILSANGKFGGVFTGNTTFSGMRGSIGLLAPTVAFTGPVVMADVVASDTAQPMIFLGAASDTRIAGGDMAQLNGRAIQVSGISQLAFKGGASSHGALIAPQRNAGRYERDGVDVTAQIVSGQ